MNFDLASIGMVRTRILPRLCAWASLLFTIFSGCSENNDALPQLAENLRLSKIFIDNQLYIEITYDAAERIESIKDYENGQLEGSSVWEYNAKGEVSKKWRTDAEGNVEGATAYEYDGNGKLIKSLTYKNVLAAPTQGTSYEYDNKGRVYAQYFFVPSQPDKIQYYIRNEYDSEGNLIEQKNYNVKNDAPDALYVEQHYQYANPQKTAALYEKMGGVVAGMMYLYSFLSYTSYENDGSGDINVAYTLNVDVEYDQQGWPTKSDATVNQTHPQYYDAVTVVTYEYIE